jgi:hypothetical protein
MFEFFVVCSVKSIDIEICEWICLLIFGIQYWDIWKKIEMNGMNMEYWKSL